MEFQVIFKFIFFNLRNSITRDSFRYFDTETLYLETDL